MADARFETPASPKDRDIDTRLLRTFLEIVRSGSFTRTATALSMSQQGVSNQVRRLEETVGSAIFNRQGPGITLTPQGEALVHLAEDVLTSVERMFSGTQPGPVLLRVGEIRGRRMLQDAWSVHRKSYPEHEFSFRDMISDEQVDAILSGQIDVGMARISDPIPGLASRPLRLDPLRVLFFEPLGPQYLKTSRLGIQAVDEERFRSWRRFREELAEAMGREFELIRHPVTMLELIGQAQIRGEIPPMLVMEGMKDYPGSENFIFHELQDVQPYHPWSLVWRKDDRRLEVRQFIGSVLSLARTRRWLELFQSDATVWLPRSSSDFA